MAAGGSVEPFWLLYQQHMTAAVQKLLPPMRIGTLDASEQTDKDFLESSDDPYANEPRRHPALKVVKQKPFNCETPASFIPDQYITPTDLWYCRHHHPVPVVDPDTFRLRVEGEGIEPRDFSLQELKDLFPMHAVTMTLQCAGNRRSEYVKATGEATQGLQWGHGVISTGKFEGVRLRDLVAACVPAGDQSDAALAAAGVRHCHFIGIDAPYDASIPVKKAMDAAGDVIIAYRMNGEDLPREHGYPLRAMVPGTLGARNVKWVGKIVLSPEEAHSNWQRGVAYKGLPPSVKNFDGVDPSKYASVQELPVQSAICAPAADVALDVEEDSVTLKGYAWSGGGRGIVRVDVSADGGSTWHQAELGQGQEQPLDQAWAWTLWEADVPLLAPLEAGRHVELVCKATDASYNTQPPEVAAIWNLRGILNNAWHRVSLDVTGSEEE